MTASKIGNGRGFFLPRFSQPVRRVRYRSATQVGGSTQAQHTRVAQLVSLEIMDGTYESIYLVAFILAGAVWYNTLKSCAVLLSPRGPSLALRAIHLVPHPVQSSRYV